MEGEKLLDPEIDDLFIDDSEDFANNNITADDKKFILDLIDKTDFSFGMPHVITICTIMLPQFITTWKLTILMILPQLITLP